MVRILWYFSPLCHLLPPIILQGFFTFIESVCSSEPRVRKGGPNLNFILVTTKMEPKPVKPIKKESSKKPIAQKEPSKLLKKEKPEATPTVQVAASTTLPPVESASKNTYLVVEGDTQKVIDYGDEVNYH